MVFEQNAATDILKNYLKLIILTNSYGKEPCTKNVLFTRGLYIQIFREQKKKKIKSNLHFSQKNARSQYSRIYSHKKPQHKFIVGIP